MNHRSGAADSMRAPLTHQAQQRVECVLFVAAPPSTSLDRELMLSSVLEGVGGRTEQLLDGSRIVLLDGHLGLTEQVILAARCALAVLRHDRLAKLALCTGRMLLAGHGRAGQLFERGALLLAEAPAGAITVDETSAALLEPSFDVLHGIKGSQLVSERPVDEAPRRPHGRLTLFVGRERELERLALLFRECVEESTSRVVLVTAPAGAGKSRLRHELAQKLARDGEVFTSITARGDSMRAGKPLAMIGSALRTFATLDGLRHPSASAEARRVRPARRPDQRVSELAPFLGELVGLHFPDEVYSELPSAVATRGACGSTCSPASSSGSPRSAERRPCCSVSTTFIGRMRRAYARCLDAALRTLGSARFAVVAFARPEVRDVHANLWSERELASTILPKLGLSSSARLLDSLCEAELDAKTHASLPARADGNPFFLEELARSVRGGRGSESLPDSILGLIQQRLDVLGEDAKLLLRAASVFGQEFHVEGLCAVLGSAVAPADVDAWLSVLAARELIMPQGAEPSREYVSHALVRDAAYALLPDEARATGHALAAEWLEAHDFCEPGVLAAHFESAGLRERATHWYGVAAAQALEASSLEEVVRCGELAVSLGAQGDSLGEVASRIAEAFSWIGVEDQRAADYARRAREHLSPRAPSWWRASQILAISELPLRRSSRPRGRRDWCSTRKR